MSPFPPTVLAARLRRVARGLGGGTVGLGLLGLGLLSLGLLGGCGGSLPVVAENTVGVAGGTVFATDGGASITIPANALDGPVVFAASPVNPANPDNSGLPGHVGRAYDFAPDGTVFADDALLRVAYDPARLPLSVQPTDLSLAVLGVGTAGSVWLPVAGSTSRPDLALVEGSVSHLSTYAAVPIALITPPVSTRVRPGRVQVGTEGTAAATAVGPGALSADGGFAVFTSAARNWVGGDFNDATDVFRVDLRNGAVDLVSVRSADAPGSTFSISGDDASGDAVISADGRYVVFTSVATDLIAVGDTSPDLFLRDMSTGVTVRIPRPTPTSGGGRSPSISADGRYIAHTAGPGIVPAQVYLYDRRDDLTTLVSHVAGVLMPPIPGNGASSSPDLSADGRWLAFASDADDLWPGDGNLSRDVFLWDRVTDQTRLVSGRVTGSGGGLTVTPADGASDAPAVSADGQVVVFDSRAPDLSPDDGNTRADVYVYDRATGATPRLISHNPQGAAANGDSTSPALSADGEFIAFSTTATDLGPGGVDGNGTGDVWVWQRAADDFRRMSAPFINTNAVVPAPGSTAPALSADARVVLFTSTAPNLVEGDRNGVADVFVVANPGPGDGINTYDPIADVDADGLDNQAEFVLTFTRAHASDSDGDGVADLAEVIAGTDPNDPEDL